LLILAYFGLFCFFCLGYFWLLLALSGSFWHFAALCGSFQLFLQHPHGNSADLPNNKVSESHSLVCHHQLDCLDRGLWVNTIKFSHGRELEEVPKPVNAFFCANRGLHAHRIVGEKAGILWEVERIK
jgi:hypothetical protein